MNGPDVLLAGVVASAANRPLAVALVGTASTALPVTSTGSASSTASTTRVASNAANVTLKAANANRLGLTIFNNSFSNLFVKLGATANIGAGTESFTIRITPNSYYEVPARWTGIVDGIWDAADATGEALITELT